MSYESIDKIQNLLATDIFHYTSDKKKAAGRALGTFLEIITYYLIKEWGLEQFVAIERPLPEFANADITHNVEFTLHGSKQLFNTTYTDNDLPISSKNIIDKCKSIENAKSNMIIDRKRIIKNACTLYEDNKKIINTYVNTAKDEYTVCELSNQPYAMFECKRVGVEEGMRKGPQTIEKAKQGSYVARTVSSLQRIRNNDGSLGGILQKQDCSYIIDDYYTLLNKIISSDDINLLKNFILTIGIVSNHGNWFTSSNPNKELKVLAQSYDWLIFLTDKGISEFITDLLITPIPKYASVKNAFRLSYSINKDTNRFTKVKMDYDSDKALCAYFHDNYSKIESWFNVIAPKEKTITDMKNELHILSGKNWSEIYN